MTISETNGATVAKQRIESRGIPFLDANYPNWRHVGYRAAVQIADPKRCLLCAVETARRTFRKDVIDFDKLNAMLREGSATSFKEVLAMHRLSFDDAVACGFARGKNDSNTFYADLRDNWDRHFRD